MIRISNNKPFPTGSFRKKTADKLMGHISKRATNNSYGSKALLFTAVGIDVYSNLVDYRKINKTKDLPKEEKNYLKAYKATNALFSAVGQTAVGLFVIKDKVQDKIVNTLFKFDKKMLKKLSKNEKLSFRKNFTKFSSLVAAIVITKRMITPLIATPVASIVKKKMNPIDKSDGMAVQSLHKEYLSDIPNIFETNQLNNNEF